LLSYRGRG